ncbi:serine/arginine repetitive matrix protein 1 isoform X2 [Plutella xylostella]|uniref:serine/arginine repetitive matrix protein 1 isoform X2 n=1 Tax=Plutella xylostella TaxID=51655 RepID=UPI0020328482|nr:serine/arginine repetitive matrix protein 1 isoform X2 [Plutella xylostella]
MLHRLHTLNITEASSKKQQQSTCHVQSNSISRIFQYLLHNGRYVENSRSTVVNPSTHRSLTAVNQRIRLIKSRSRSRSPRRRSYSRGRSGSPRRSPSPRRRSPSPRRRSPSPRRSRSDSRSRY